MDKKSCGAIFYTFNPDGELGIVLGDESRSTSDGWLPFKGGCRPGETAQEAAIREVHEESCGLIQLKEIDLQHRFTTKRKEYHIGLCCVPYSLIAEFDVARRLETREEFREKRKLKFFKFPDVLNEPLVHNISKSSILFYKDQLQALQKSRDAGELGPRARCLGISSDVAESIKTAAVGDVNSPADSPTYVGLGKSVDKPTRDQVRDLSDKFETFRLSTRHDSKSRKSALLARPKKFNMSYTPRAEKLMEQTRVWRMPNEQSNKVATVKS